MSESQKPSRDTSQLTSTKPKTEIAQDTHTKALEESSPNVQTEGVEESRQDMSAEAKDENEEVSKAAKSRLMHVMKCSLGLYGPLDKPKPIVSEFTLKGVGEYIKSKNCNKIIVMSGAGISTAAGIPDYRSPGTGLYHNLQKYNLKNPEMMNSIEYFKEDPRPYFERAKAMLEKTIKPTLTHYFIKCLENEGRLLRVFTQNIDGLEHAAGVSEDKIVEAHGSNRKGHCMECNEFCPQEKMREKILTTKVPRCDSCNGVVKPDVVLFGESLPDLFMNRVKEDFPVCDCLLVMGTSLQVQPFASLTGKVEADVLRVLINREKCTGNDPFMKFLGLNTGLDFDSEYNFRDVFYEGSCDDGCLELAQYLGFKGQVKALYNEAHRDESTTASRTPSAMGSGSARRGVSIPSKSKPPGRVTLADQPRSSGRTAQAADKSECAIKKVPRTTVKPGGTSKAAVTKPKSSTRRS